MNILEYQKWITDFYKTRGWYDLDAFIRVNFLTEEVGEVSKAIRTIEIGRDRPDEVNLSKEQQVENLKEELGDVLDNLFILADKYEIDLTEIMESHKEKLTNRYK
ncbi:NTP pyrophosphatase (non-canonical NTP hydrolase) [Ureibacillus xyleni]|uniref:NTP pyrophosphatase (Non-canonical NTP hydrolase) n=1 Tax=Ureibacillus xyleni TaxID=614648 RepID=A0A285SFV2_9BACL|nr:MazG-like family protein [Ureibacillus xyleni]SOC06469.1 NTP pyrophosphatase (non-canonical NTP hydrolase) [Ureibacillus xyleni]